MNMHLCSLAAALALSSAQGAAAEVLTFGSGDLLDSLGYAESGMVATVPSDPPRAHIANYQPFQLPGEREMIINSLTGGYTSVRFSLASGDRFDLLGFTVEDATSNEPGTGLAIFNRFFVAGSTGAAAEFLATDFGAVTLSNDFEGLEWFSFGCSEGNFCQAIVDDIRFDPIGQGHYAPEPSAFLLV